MVVGIGVVMLALGAILIWGTSAEVGGVDLALVGVFLMALGAAGLVAALLYRPERSARGRDDGFMLDR